MKQFNEPTIEILRLEEVDILAASNDRLSWDIHDPGSGSGWVID